MGEETSFFRINFGGLHHRVVDGICMDHLSFRRWARWVTQRIKDGKLYLAMLELISGLLWHLRCLSSQRFSASMMIASVVFTAKPCVLFLNMEWFVKIMSCYNIGYKQYNQLFPINIKVNMPSIASWIDFSIHMYGIVVNIALIRCGNKNKVNAYCIDNLRKHAIGCLE